MRALALTTTNSEAAGLVNDLAAEYDILADRAASQGDRDAPGNEARLRGGQAARRHPTHPESPERRDGYRPRHQRHRPQPRKGVKRRELHIYVLRRDGLRVPHAASDDDKSRKNFQSFLKSLCNARDNYSMAVRSDPFESAKSH